MKSLDRLCVLLKTAAGSCTITIDLEQIAAWTTGFAIYAAETNSLLIEGHVKW